MRLHPGACATLVLLCGCAPHKYEAVRVVPSQIAAGLESRSLDDAGLRDWMRQAASFEPASWPLSSWDLSALTLAAYYYNPQMDVARANAMAADAAIKTASMKPNPSIAAGAGYETAPESPYLLTLDFSLPIETAGKRGYRIAEATHLSESARLQVGETAWTVRSAVRSAVVDLVFATNTVTVLRNQETVQGQYADLLDARFHAGEIPLPEVTTARIDLTNVRQARRTAEGQVETARAALAAAIGIPLSGLAGKTVNWPLVLDPPASAELPSQSVRAEAVANRINVQRALEQYEASQSRLQLQVARQHPDIDLGPGYAFEEGAHLISLQLGTILPLRNRNEGPIAEAEAQRKAAGAQLLAEQTSVIAQTDKALAQYKAALAVLKEARQSAEQAEAQRQSTYAWLKSGESDRLVAVLADIQAAIAERARLDALHQVQLALGSLEDALQRPIDPAVAPVLPERAPR